MGWVFLLSSLFGIPYSIHAKDYSSGHASLVHFDASFGGYPLFFSIFFGYSFLCY